MEGIKINIPTKTEVPRERHTEDMQEIITKVPSWILRWGITLFFGILLMAVGISVMVTYPDTVKGGLKLESASPAAPVAATTPIKLVKIVVTKGATVKKGDTLAFTDSYALAAPRDGRVAFVGIVQPGVVLRAGQPVFAVHPLNEQFFGLMEIPAGSINNIKEGQQVLVKLRSYPAEEYGHLKGRVSYIADEPAANGLFMVKVDINNAGLNKPIALKTWMPADGEIITENISLQKRLFRSIFKGLY